MARPWTRSWRKCQPWTLVRLGQSFLVHRREPRAPEQQRRGQPQWLLVLELAGAVLAQTVGGNHELRARRGVSRLSRFRAEQHHALSADAGLFLARRQRTVGQGRTTDASCLLRRQQFALAVV